MTLRQDQLRPASIRGVPCYVDEGELDAGRRLQVHEYPQRDKPWAEDMGRATRSMTVTAFVVGDDYLQQAERLLQALETPGPGTLVHPWLGSMQVSFGVAKVRYRMGALGYAEFQIPCTEAGELTFPGASSSTPARSRIAADTLEVRTVEQYASAYSVDGRPDFVVSAADAAVRGVVSVLQRPVPGLEALGVAERVSAVAQDITGAINDPARMATLLRGALSLTSAARTAARWSVVVQALVRLAQGPALASPPQPAVVTSNRLQVWRNDVATMAMTRRLILAQAVGASSLLDAVVYDDVVAINAGLTAALDAESLVAGDATYTALTGARVAVWQDLTARARNAARLRTVSLQRPLPALAVAYDLYGDAARDAEIVMRNRVRHPGFVPAAPLRVLSS
jgi:prophage DNA circulation protein